MLIDNDDDAAFGDKGLDLAAGDEGVGSGFVFAGGGGGGGGSGGHNDKSPVLFCFVLLSFEMIAFYRLRGVGFHTLF